MIVPCFADLQSGIYNKKQTPSLVEIKVNRFHKGYICVEMDLVVVAAAVVFMFRRFYSISLSLYVPLTGQLRDHIVNSLSSSSSSTTSSSFPFP